MPEETILENSNNARDEASGDEGGSFFRTPYNIDIEKLDESALKRYIDRVRSLPDKLRNFMFDLKPAEYIEQTLSKQFGLSENQMPGLLRIIKNIALSDLFIGDMPSQIAVQLNIDSAKARDIANKIVNQLFTPVLEDIKQVQKERFGNKVQSFGSQGQESPKTMPPPSPPAIPAQPQRSIPQTPLRSMPPSSSAMGQNPIQRPQPQIQKPTSSLPSPSILGQPSSLPPNLPVKSLPPSAGQVRPAPSTTPATPSASSPGQERTTEDNPFDNAQDKPKQYNVINLKDL